MSSLSSLPNQVFPSVFNEWLWNVDCHKFWTAWTLHFHRKIIVKRWQFSATNLWRHPWAKRDLHSMTFPVFEVPVTSVESWISDTCSRPSIVKQYQHLFTESIDFTTLCHIFVCPFKFFSVLFGGINELYRDLDWTAKIAYSCFSTEHMM